MFKKLLSLSVIICFFLSTLFPYQAHADSVLDLPTPGTMVNLTPAYVPVIVKGLRVHPENPILFDFIVDTGNTGLTTNSPELKVESEKLIKYFLVSLTIPEDDLWVNLSPYEKNRIIPDQLGQTEMGRDMLAEDYILKQLTASLIYPEKDLGKEFWNRVYSKAQEQYGTSQVPVNTFNKVWIVADKAKVYVHDNTAFVVASHLKVMLEEDYLALQKHNSPSILSFPNASVGNLEKTHTIASQIVRSIILPELEKEVNSGKNFANLRQIFHSMILAAWYKKNLKEALLNQVYSDKSKINGINRVIASEAKQSQQDLSPEQIYQQYLKAYKKGVFNYIKEDIQNGQAVPRKYFSGGLKIDAAQATEIVGSGDQAVLAFEQHPSQGGDLVLVDAAMANAEKINPDARTMEKKINSLEILKRNIENGKNYNHVAISKNEITLTVLFPRITEALKQFFKDQVIQVSFFETEDGDRMVYSWKGGQAKKASKVFTILAKYADTAMTVSIPWERDSRKPSHETVIAFIIKKLKEDYALRSHDLKQISLELDNKKVDFNNREIQNAPLSGYVTLEFQAVVIGSDLEHGPVTFSDPAMTGEKPLTLHKEQPLDKYNPVPLQLSTPGIYVVEIVSRKDNFGKLVAFKVGPDLEISWKNFGSVENYEPFNPGEDEYLHPIRVPGTNLVIAQIKRTDNGVKFYLPKDSYYGPSANVALLSSPNAAMAASGEPITPEIPGFNVEKIDRELIVNEKIESILGKVNQPSYSFNGYQSIMNNFLNNRTLGTLLSYEDYGKEISRDEAKKRIRPDSIKRPLLIRYDGNGKTLWLLIEADAAMVLRGVRAETAMHEAEWYFFINNFLESQHVPDILKRYKSDLQKVNTFKEFLNVTIKIREEMEKSSDESVLKYLSSGRPLLKNKIGDLEAKQFLISALRGSLYAAYMKSKLSHSLGKHHFILLMNEHIQEANTYGEIFNVFLSLSVSELKELYSVTNEVKSNGQNSEANAAMTAADKIAVKNLLSGHIMDVSNGTHEETLWEALRNLINNENQGEKLDSAKKAVVGGIDNIVVNMRNDNPANHFLHELLGLMEENDWQKSLRNKLSELDAAMSTEEIVRRILKAKNPTEVWTSVGLSTEANPTNGGIDLNSRNMQLDENGQKIDIKFDKAMIVQFESGDFSGVRPVIMSITPIVSVLPLLGFKEDGGRLARI